MTLNIFANSLKHIFCFEAPQTSPWLPNRTPTQKHDSQGDLWQWFSAGESVSSVLFLSQPKHFVVSASAPWRSVESIKLSTSFPPEKGHAVPLPELLLKIPLRVTADLHSYYDWGTSLPFPLTKLAFLWRMFSLSVVCWSESVILCFCGALYVQCSKHRQHSAAENI